MRRDASERLHTEQSRSSPFRCCSLLPTHKRPHSEKRSFLPLHMQAIPVLNDSRCSNGAFPLALCCSPVGRLLLLFDQNVISTYVTSGAGESCARITDTQSSLHLDREKPGKAHCQRTLYARTTLTPCLFCRELRLQQEHLW